MKIEQRIITPPTFKADDLISMHSSMLGERSSWDGKAEDLVREFLPEDKHSETLEQRDQPVSESQKPIDSTGVQSAIKFANAMHSNTLSMGAEWFKLSLLGESDGEAVDWLEAAGTVLLQLHQSSSFSQTYSEMLLPWGVLGQGIHYSDYTLEAGMITKNFSPFACVVGYDHNGLVDTVMRKFSFSAKQCFQRWGEDCAEKVVVAAKDLTKQEMRVSLIHVVLPNPDYVKGSVTATEGKFVDLYVDVSHKKVMGAFCRATMPYQAPRMMSKYGDTYGRGIGHFALGDMRSLIRSVRNFHTAVEMATLPPLGVASADVKQFKSLMPGVVVPLTDPSAVRPLAGNLVNPTPLYQFIMDQRQSIRMAFYLDVFNAMQGNENMTAKEVIERVNERVQNIATIVGRLHEEFFRRHIMHILRVVEEAGKLPPRPESLIGQEDKVEIVYTSRIDYRLQQTEIDNVTRSVAQVAELQAMAQQAPGVQTLLNMPEISRRILSSNGVEPNLYYNEIEQRQMEQKMAAQMAKQQSVAAMGQAMQPMDPNSRPPEGSVGGDLLRQISQTAQPEGPI
jgi:hypothetical protein